MAFKWRMAIERVAIWQAVDAQLMALGAATDYLGSRRAVFTAASRSAMSGPGR